MVKMPSLNIPTFVIKPISTCISGENTEVVFKILVTLAFSFLSVIGRGGEQINKLQSETGAKIQVAPGTL